MGTAPVCCYPALLSGTLTAANDPACQLGAAGDERFKANRSLKELEGLICFVPPPAGLFLLSARPQCQGSKQHGLLLAWLPVRSITGRPPVEHRSLIMATKVQKIMTQ